VSTNAEPPTEPRTDAAAEPLSAGVLRASLGDLLQADEDALRRRLSGVKRIRQTKRRAKTLERIAADIDKARAKADRRRASFPKITYPPELPITERRDELVATIENNQVVIVAGETGSGKSTQLPKLCLEAGRGARGFIGHTQPRRLAARTIAERVADELGTTVGATVGYAVRFTDKVSESTLVKQMTDGILLAEIQRDRRLLAYDTLIIDEAHERSLNIDVLLGFLCQLLPKRPDLKVIITSATIDTERFSKHFGDAPVVEVSGRTYPVEVRYRPLDGNDGYRSLDAATAVGEAAAELQDEGPGDILVFCAGERDIREATTALTKLHLPNTEILPLYARLSAAEQQRVFQPHKKRRIVVATNVAETSLTVPGVRYVIDTGTARISRFNQRTKVQRLPIEAVSQASANQRAGRCGRLGPGICIRLYAEDDFESRAAFTEPEIQRTNLASVILQMAAIGFYSIESFPFLDPPDERSIADGIALLHELGAIDPTNAGTADWLTPLGRELVRLPVDPRLGRMVIEGERNGCLHEVMVLAAALSIQDPRDRPAERRTQADDMHERFDHPGSDFLGFLDLWEYLEGERRDRRSNQFRRMCQREFLNFNRVREWFDIYRQLNRVTEQLDYRRNSHRADAEVVHRSVLAGLLSHLGMRDGDQPGFKGARNSRFVIAGGSVMAKTDPSWVMAGQLVETDRLRARIVARIEPEWIEDVGNHLVKRTYGEPRWDREEGDAVVDERVMLYGLPVIPQRTLALARVKPDSAREMFLHHALIHGEWDEDYAFIAQNEGVFSDVVDLEARSRRRDLFVDYEQLYAFYDARIPGEVVDAASFERWWTVTQRDEPHLLNLALDELIDLDDAAIDEEAFPPTWSIGSIDLPLSYEFDHASPRDGVTMEVPVTGFGHLDAEQLEWNVPGLRDELVTALLRSLPKSIRRNLVPIPDTVAVLLPALRVGEGSLRTQLRHLVQERTGLDVPPDAMPDDAIPDYLRPTIRVVNDAGDLLAEGKDLGDLQRVLSAQIADALDDVGAGLTQTGATSWTFGSIARTYVSEVQGQSVTAYPSLVDEGDTVGLRLLPTQGEQGRSMWTGTRRLLRLTVGAPLRLLNDLLTNEAMLAMALGPHSGRPAWFEDCIACAHDALLKEAGGPVWEEADFLSLRLEVKDNLHDMLDTIGPKAIDLLVLHGDIRRRLAEPRHDRMRPAVIDMSSHVDRLIYDGYLTGVGAERLDDLVRYLGAISHRLDKLPDRVANDATHLVDCRELESEFEALLDTGLGAPPSQIEEVSWLLEEFRVLCFAQHLQGAHRVSRKKVRAALRSLRNS